jgi:protein-tyrosine kinase
MKLKLSRKNEKLITDNVKELSMVEGNLMSAIEAQKAKRAQQINSDTQEIPSEPQSLSIYITSCFNLEGKTTSALSMAYALTVNNMKRVLLIDGNPRAPKLHEHFETGIAPGLMDWFKSEEMNRAAIVRETEYSNLFLMTFGNVADQRPDLFTSEFKEKFESLKQSFDYIIFDGNSMLDSSNPALLAKNFDGIVITVSSEKTKWEVVQQAIEKVQNLEGIVLGVILNNRKYYLPNNFDGRM